MAKLKLRNLPTARPHISGSFNMFESIIMSDDGTEEAWHGASTIYDNMVAEEVDRTLRFHYPGHAWLVHCSHAMGLLIIRNRRLNAHMAYSLHVRKYTLPELKKHAIEAGGEWLERFGIRRRRAAPEEYEHLPTNRLIKGGEAA